MRDDIRSSKNPLKFFLIYYDVNNYNFFFEDEVYVVLVQDEWNERVFERKVMIIF